MLLICLVVQHVDKVMDRVGHQIMESVILVLESGAVVEVKEQVTSFLYFLHIALLFS